jgi:glyoxylase-like metal-dependent hydrolase (beta-lactamase superfamily II)
MPLLPSIAEPTTWLQGDERFTADGRAWEVIHTPGHPPGHVCLWSAADRILPSGDHLLPAITSPVTFERGFERDPMSSYLDSLQRVAALAPALVLPGHGDPFPDGSGRAAATSTGMPLLASAGLPGSARRTAAHLRALPGTAQEARR